MGDEMWLRRSTTSSELGWSQQQQVVVDREDLLALILLRVPYRKLKSIKSVSKKWLILITSPHFTRSLCNLLPPRRACALFIQRPPVLDAVPNVVYFVPLDDPTTPSPFKNLTFANVDPFDPQRIRIWGSCNGLLLCSTCPLPFGHQILTYVYNPSTNQLAILPQHPHPSHNACFISLAFDPSKSPHYKVISFVRTSDSIGDFYVYSSQTGTWTRSVHSFYKPPDIHLYSGVYCRGCIHWLSALNLDAPTTSTYSDGWYFNVDEGRLGTFPTPPIDVTRRRKFYFGESEDHLHFIEVCRGATSLTVYEMKTDYSGWFFKYWIDLAPISKVFPEMTKHDNGNNYAVAVLSLIRRENFQEDSFLVLEIPGKAIRYNLVDKSFKAIWDFAAEFGLDLEKVHIWKPGRFKVWQYIEALSCV